MLRLAVILVFAFLILAALAWFHILPGGWFLRNLIEDPSARAERLQREHRDRRLAAFAQDAGRLAACDDCCILAERRPFVQRRAQDRADANSRYGEEVISISAVLSSAALFCTASASAAVAGSS